MIDLFGNFSIEAVTDLHVNFSLICQVISYWWNIDLSKIRSRGFLSIDTSINCARRWRSIVSVIFVEGRLKVTTSYLHFCIFILYLWFFQGLGLDPPTDDCEEAYSPSNARSFTPPPPISKFAQPILDKVSDITIPPNLQEILANVKRQESSKVDPYLPSKPSASFLPALYKNPERYSPSPSSRISQSEKTPLEVPKENRSTLSTLSDLDLIRKAEEELAAVEAAAASTGGMPAPPPASSASSSLLGLTPPAVGSVSDAPMSPPLQVLPSLSAEPTLEANKSYKLSPSNPFKKSFTPEQPKPPGLEDEDFPSFPSTPPTMDVSKVGASHSNVSSKSGIVLNVKRKLSDSEAGSPSRLPRTKSRWGQRPSE